MLAFTFTTILLSFGSYSLAKNELKRPFSDSTENLTITTNTYEHLLTKAKYNKQSVENVKRNLMGEFGSNKDANQSEQNLAALKFNLITTDTPFTESNAVVSEKMATTASNFDIEPNDLVTHNDPSWESANLPDTSSQFMIPEEELSADLPGTTLTMEKINEIAFFCYQNIQSNEEQNVELFAHYKEMNSNIEFIAVFNLDENPNIYQIHCFKDGNNAKNYDQNQQLSSYQFDKCFICGIDDKSCSSHDLQKQPSSSDCDDELCSSCESQKKFSSSDLDDKPCSSHDLQQQLSSSDLDDKPCSSHDLQKQLSSSDLDDKPSASRDFQKQLSSSDLDDKPCSSSNLQKPHPGHTDDESCCSNFVINQMRDPPKRSIPTKLIYGLRAECVASKSMEIADENAIVKRINWLIHQEEILMKNKESDSTLESMNLRPSMGFNPGDYANESYDDDFQKALQLSILDAIDRQKQNDLSDFSD